MKDNTETIVSTKKNFSMAAEVRTHNKSID